MVNRLLLCSLIVSLLLPLKAVEQLQDPTRPLVSSDGKNVVTEQENIQLPTLQSVIMGDGSARAVINGEIYRAGQSVADFKVVGIDTDSVVLERAGKRHRMTIFAKNINVKGNSD